MAHMMATQDQNGGSSASAKENSKNSTKNENESATEKSLVDQENLVVMLLASGKEVYRTKIDRASFRYTEFSETIKEVIRNKLDDKYELIEEEVVHDEL